MLSSELLDGVAHRGGAALNYCDAWHAGLYFQNASRLVPLLEPFTHPKTLFILE